MASASAWAGDGGLVAQAQQPGEDTLVLYGFVDSAYVWNSTRPINHLARGNFSAPRTNEFTINLAALGVRHDATPRAPWSFELALQFGPAADALLVDEPKPGEADARFAGSEVWKHLGRANGGYRFYETGTDIGVGVFSTPIGIYSFWNRDNPTQSTPWHLNGVPYVLMGGRLVQAIGEKFEAQAWVVNGWQTYGDVNRVPSFLVGLYYRPSAKWSIGEFVHVGPETEKVTWSATRTLSDFQVAYSDEKWLASLVFDVGYEHKAWPTGKSALFGALSLTARRLLLAKERHQLYLAGRGEVYHDPDGRIFGVPQSIASGVLDLDWRIGKALLLRGEYRYDHSTSAGGYFYGSRRLADESIALRRNQHLATLAAIVSFDWPVPGR